MPSLAAFLSIAEQAAVAAGRAVAALARQSSWRLSKDDGSPLTEADEAAHQALLQHLSGTGLEVVSEENQVRQPEAERYWLVDPLDGTREWLRGGRQWVVAVALMEGAYPVLGVIAALPYGLVYAAAQGVGARLSVQGQVQPWQAVARHQALPRVLGSHSHHYAAEADLLQRLPSHEWGSCASALKFARVAWAEAECYPRAGHLASWDIAAGQALVEITGGQVLSLATGQRLAHHAPGFRCDGFVAVRGPYQAAEFWPRAVE